MAGYGGGMIRAEYVLPAGRWPANLVLCHEPGCNGTCEDGCAVRKLGEQSGERPCCGTYRNETGPGARFFGGSTNKVRLQQWNRGDTGTAARFFTQVGWQLEQAEPLYYCAKAGRRERDKGLEEWEAKPGVVHIPQSEGRQLHQVHADGQHLTMPRHNPHPTVKPIALARHLATLLLPPPEYAPRRILVPFAGSGSEMIGAMLAGWEEVVGIEQDAEYCELARARIAHWAQQPALEIA
jgi:hypothetical protein